MTRPWTITGALLDAARTTHGISAIEHDGRSRDLPYADLLADVLLMAGGLIYSAGVAFYLIERIPFHKAIWHGFVLAAAVLHFAAIAMEFTR